MSKKSRKAWWAKQKATKAWFQGQNEKTVEGPVTSNNPDTLGYPKEMGYEKKPMETTAPGGQDTRPWEQQWFEGAAAETEKVMGPKGEEFKLKQEQQRIPMDEKVANAKLTAKFKAIAGNPKGSYWTIFANGEPVLKATLDEIWGKELDEKTAKETATASYAKDVFAKIRQEGFSKVSYLLTGKTAKAEKKAETKKAWYKEELDVENALNDEVAATDAELGVTGDMASSKLEEIESLEMQIVEKIAPEPKAMEVFTGLQEAEKALEEAGTEVAEIQAKLKSKTLTAAKKISVLKLAEAAIADAVATFEAADEMMGEAAELLPAAEAPVAAAEGAEGGAEAQADAAIEAAKEYVADGQEVTEVVEAPVEVPVEAPAAEVEVVASSDIKKFVAARKSRREALAAMKEEQKYNVIPAGGTKDGADEVKAAHPQGGHNVTNLTAGGKPKNDGEKFETTVEAQNKDLEVATKMPKGTLSASSKAKTTTAAADGEAKSYWVDFFSQMGPEGKAFGQALTSDHFNMKGEEVGKAAAAMTSKQVQSAVEVERGKLLRASELAELAASKGMVEPTVPAKMELVKQIMDFDDKAFAAYKSAVEKAPSKRVVAAEELGIRTASAKALKVGQLDQTSVAESDDLSVLSSFNWS